MRAKSRLAGLGVIAAASVIAGCGTVDQARTGTVANVDRADRVSTELVAGDPPGRAASTVYDWGRYGGADPAGTVGDHGWSASFGGWYRGGPARVVRRPTPVRGITGTVRQVATSNSDGYALTTAGRVYAWGAGAQGELGDGASPTLSTSAVRVRFPAGVRIARLANPMPFRRS